MSRGMNARTHQGDHGEVIGDPASVGRCSLTHSPLDQAIELMREAQRLLDTDHPVIAAHLETAIGLAVERGGTRADGPRYAN